MKYVSCNRGHKTKSSATITHFYYYQTIEKLFKAFKQTDLLFLKPKF